MIYHWKALDVYFPMPLKSPHLDFPSSSYASSKKVRSSCQVVAKLLPITHLKPQVGNVLVPYSPKARAWGWRCCKTRPLSSTLATCSSHTPRLISSLLEFHFMFLFLGPKDDSGLASILCSTIDYYIWLESSECQLSNATGITQFGSL